MKIVLLIPVLVLILIVSGCTQLGSVDYSEILENVSMEYHDDIIDYCETFWGTVDSSKTHFCVMRYGMIFSHSGGCYQEFYDRHIQFCNNIDTGNQYLDSQFC